MDVYTGMVLATLIFVASLVSVELGISAAIIEITLGVLAGNLIHVQQLDWVKYIAILGESYSPFLQVRK
jgi:ABC-type dipeptide/oligopeptide/nickel transport system permease component